MGQDLAEGKATLPLIYALQKANPMEVKMLRHAIEEGSSKNLMQLIKIIQETGSIAYTSQLAKNHANQAKKALSTLPLNPYVQALIDLTDFIVERHF